MKRQNILKLFLLSIAVIGAYVLVSHSVLAQSPSPSAPPPAPSGGLVPCDRMADDPSTPGIDESKPCNLCSTFYMVKSSINFVLADIAVPLGVLMLVICGLVYAFSSGNPQRISKAKIVLTNTIIGLVIIFTAWLAIAAILQMAGYANIATWNQVNCTL